MAGINRLGKAPPKPGTLRPPDPNKYRTLDIYSEGGEGDMEYMRMVRDIEDMQQQQGWLFGRGAFDKADLLYLRDTAEQQRHLENELRDRELMQFAALKAEVDHGQEDRNRAGSTSGTSKTRTSKKPPLVKLCKVVKGRPPDDAIEQKNKRMKTTLDEVEAPQTSARDMLAVQEEVNDCTPGPGSNHDKDDDSGQGLLGLLPDYGSESDTSEHDGDQQTEKRCDAGTSEQIDRG